MKRVFVAGFEAPKELNKLLEQKSKQKKKKSYRYVLDLLKKDTNYTGEI